MIRQFGLIVPKSALHKEESVDFTPVPPECPSSKSTSHEFITAYRWSCDGENWYSRDEKPELTVIDDRWQCKYCGKPATEEETTELNTPRDEILSF